MATARLPRRAFSLNAVSVGGVFEICGLLALRTLTPAHRICVELRNTYQANHAGVEMEGVVSF